MTVHTAIYIFMLLVLAAVAIGGPCLFYLDIKKHGWNKDR